jgi:hypothetical protein
MCHLQQQKLGHVTVWDDVRCYAHHTQAQDGVSALRNQDIKADIVRFVFHLTVQHVTCLYTIPVLWMLTAACMLCIDSKLPTGNFNNAMRRLAQAVPLVLDQADVKHVT